MVDYTMDTNIGVVKEDMCSMPTIMGCISGAAGSLVVDTDSHSAHHVGDCLDDIVVDTVTDVDLLDNPTIPAAAPTGNCLTVGTVRSTSIICLV